MNTQQTGTSAPRLCRNDGKESIRAVTLAEVDLHLDNLKRCIHWLVAQGVFIIAIDMSRNQSLPHITISASPWLHSLFRGDCADTGQRQQGNLKIVPWIAKRYDCLICWEEVTA